MLGPPGRARGVITGCRFQNSVAPVREERRAQVALRASASIRGRKPRGRGGWFHNHQLPAPGLGVPFGEEAKGQNSPAEARRARSQPT